MVDLVYLAHQPMRPLLEGSTVRWHPVEGCRTVQLTSLIWSDGRPWREANHWLLDSLDHLKERTIATRAAVLKYYGSWLEEVGLSWNDLPMRRSDRPLNRFRAHLIEQRDSGALAPSTVKARMGCVLRFYIWAVANGILTPDRPLWTTRHFKVLVQPGATPRTIHGQTTDLSIPNRERFGNRLESGARPVSTSQRQLILQAALEHCPLELYLMLCLGFLTGLRLGSILDLKVQTLQRATPEPNSRRLFRLSVGPNASPPVATKHDVSGQVLIPSQILEDLLLYARSPRRLGRVAHAQREHEDVLFLTNRAVPYRSNTARANGAVNVLMHRLRQVLAKKGEISDFKFHDTRATFATEMADAALKIGHRSNAISVVKDLLLHKDEATTLRYIKFVEQQPVREHIGRAFANYFHGVAREQP
jgi:integrase